MVLFEGLLGNGSNGYTKVTKLTKIVQLLRIYRDHDERFREGKVLQAVGEEALRQRDYPVALKVCNLILQRKLEHGWELCKIVGRINDLPKDILNDELRLALLSFALAFCPESDVDVHFDILNHIKNIKLEKEDIVSET